MPYPIERISIRGFKSIRELNEFELGPLNLLIGANGSGKSNFLSFFAFLQKLASGELARFVKVGGGADAFLHLGPKVTSRLEAHVRFGLGSYEFSLEPTDDGRFGFVQERFRFEGSIAGRRRTVDRSGNGGREETRLLDTTPSPAGGSFRSRVYGRTSETLSVAILDWLNYHVHDTGSLSPLRRSGSVRDHARLRPDGGNLPAFLLRLRERHPGAYESIRDTVRQVAPFFHDFLLRPEPAGDDEVVRLEWTQKHGDYPFLAGQLSDGTLRFMTLAAALLQPDPPATILIDEPELGLHPYALGMLAGLMQQASKKTQLIVSTQSADLLNEFRPEDVVVVDRHEGESRFRRLREDELNVWLADDYGLGDLWRKNVFGGSPTHE